MRPIDDQIKRLTEHQLTKKAERVAVEEIINYINENDPAYLVDVIVKLEKSKQGIKNIKE